MTDDLARRCELAIHVITPDGNVLSAGRASLYVMEVIGWRRFAKVFSKPALQWLVERAYGFVANHRALASSLFFRAEAVSAAVRLQQVRLTVCLALIAGFVLTPGLWISSRSYPLMPVSDLLPPIVFPFDYALFGILVLLVGIAGFARSPGRWFMPMFAVAGVMSLYDQSRWQPWFYQYLLMLAVIARWYWRGRAGDTDSAALHSCRIIVACIYLWSGLHKLNRSFINVGFAHLLQGVYQIPPGALKYIWLLGALVPILEASIGVGLMTMRFRRVSVILAIMTHLFILTVLGPFGHNVDHPVWPWNIAMMAFVVLLFWDKPELRTREILWPKYGMSHACVILLFAILPAFSFIQLWDSYLSFALFSGDVKIAYIHVSEGLRNNLPPDLRAYVTKEPDGRYSFDYHRWGVGETKVPVYPESRIYQRIAGYTCQYAKVPSDVELTIGERSLSALAKSIVHLRLESTFRRTDRYDCRSLGL